MEKLDTVSPNFGIDYGGPLSDEDVGTVDVLETINPLDDQELRIF